MEPLQNEPQPERDIMNFRIESNVQEPQVLFLDNHIFVVGKPAGYLSQADETGDIDIITWCKSFLKRKFQKPGNVFAGLVHRLDRPASGVMIIARTSKAASRLASQWKNRVPKKRYVALVEGEMIGKAQLVDYIQKNERISRIVPQSNPLGKQAILDYEVLGSNSGLSLVDIRLETGRSHQIRLQFSNQGFPLMGDFRYGGQREFDGENLALHAYSLEIIHPVSKKNMVFSWVTPLESWAFHFHRIKEFFPSSFNQAGEPRS